MGLLVGKNFNLPSKYICVGNGAVEIIKVLMTELESPVGVLLPSFEEYINQLSEEQVIPFYVGELERNYQYTEDHIIHYFKDLSIKTLIVVNPENPSGNYIGKAGMEKLLRWTRESNIRLILDESFLDFAEEGETDSCLNKEVLEENRQLVILKSISKAHGVPGIRLGFAASGNEELLKVLKKKLPIWNTNSFAEFYLQIFEKYKSEFQTALKSFIPLRAGLEDSLRRIPFLEVLPTQSNFFMCKVKAPYTALLLTEKLLNEHNLFIKNLTGKKGLKGDWIRLAVKTKSENEKIVEVLKSL